MDVGAAEPTEAAPGEPQPAADAKGGLERGVRLCCRDIFHRARLVERIIPDIRLALGEGEDAEEFLPDSDPALPTDLWTPSAEQEAEE